MGVPTYAQEQRPEGQPPPEQKSEEQKSDEQKSGAEKPKAQQPEPAQAERAPAVAGVPIKPGQPAIKTQEIQAKPVSPWKRFPRNILNDQKHIWTSPFRASKADAKWWGLFGGATGLLIATDKWTSRQLPNTSQQISVARWTSRLGAAYTLIPVTLGFYFIGTYGHNERFRETGLIAAEALVDSYLVVNIIKTATQRERPLEGDGDGRFWRGGGRVWNGGASFPSGHAIDSWALASVIAHEYPRPRIIPIVSYGLATTVVASRFAARKHFASDLVIASAMGWFIGDYVFQRRHNPNVDKTSKLRRVLAHVRFGFAYY